MNYFVTIIITLCLDRLMCHGVGSLQKSSFNNLISQQSNETRFHGIQDFFYHFKESYVKKRKPRHVVILAATDEDVQEAEPLFQNYPFVVYTKTTNGDLYPDILSPGSFVFVLLPDLTEKSFNKNVEILSRCAEGKVLFVSGGTIDIKDIRLLFRLAIRINLGFPEFAHFDGNVVKLYSHFIADNCQMEVRLMLIWKPGDQLNTMNDWAFRPRNRNGCPVSVSTFIFEPKMILQLDNDNRAVSIVGGREGKLVLAVAEKLNFTVLLKLPSVIDRNAYSYEASIVRDVINGDADIGIGRLRPTSDINESIVKFSLPYDDECITWGVPRIVKLSNDVLTMELNWEVWALVGLAFAIGCTTSYYLQKIGSPKDGDKKKMGFAVIILDLIAIHLGNPAVNVPAPLGGKFSLLAFLCYATVLTTAYKTSLASILTTENATPTIVDAQGIIDANLDVEGSQYDFNVLSAQANGSEITTKLVIRFKINNSDKSIMERLKRGENVAFLTRASHLRDEQERFLKAQESVGFDVIKSCVLFYHTVMVVRRASFLRGPASVVIRRLSEAGILKHWDSDRIDVDKILKQTEGKIFFEKRAADKFKTVFLLYFCCIVFSILSFFFELIIHTKSKS